MVVCKCRKVWQYSDWVNDGDYDWPPHCAVCSESLEDTDKPTIRLSCLRTRALPPPYLPHLPVRPFMFSSSCRPACRCSLPAPLSSGSVGIAPGSGGCGGIAPGSGGSGGIAPGSGGSGGIAPGSGGSGGIAPGSDVILSTPVTSDPAAASAQATALSDKTVPPAFASGPLAVPQQQGGVNIARSRTGGSDRTAVDITEEIETAYRTDEEAGERKYARRGPAHLQFLRVLGSWWSPALHALPVTLTATHSHRRDKDEHAPVGAHEDGRRRAGQRRSGGVDPRKLLLIVAIV
ncbi:unnamed protein product [Closterium sp. NIES-65]|nr:unnamed protein product [Closterium sp. NIES-65]